jgi:hypothetical protein
MKCNDRGLFWGTIPAQILTNGEKTWNASVGTTGNHTEIKTGYVPTTGIERYCGINMLGSFKKLSHYTTRRRLGGGGG